jgi:hypothetical protein
MENKNERPQSHEDRKAQKLMKRIDETQAFQDVAKAADTTKVLEEYGKKVGS